MVREVALCVEKRRHRRYRCNVNRRLWGHRLQCTASAQSCCSGCTWSLDRQLAWLALVVPSSAQPYSSSHLLLAWFLSAGPSPSASVLAALQPFPSAALLIPGCWFCFVCCIACYGAQSGLACWLSICPSWISFEFSKRLGTWLYCFT